MYLELIEIIKNSKHNNKFGSNSKHVAVSKYKKTLLSKQN